MYPVICASAGGIPYESGIMHNESIDMEKRSVHGGCNLSYNVIPPAKLM